MPETTPLIKAALNLRVGAGFDVYGFSLLPLFIHDNRMLAERAFYCLGILPIFANNNYTLTG